MDFGISLAASADAWRVVKRAEALGFSHAWFYDTSSLYADPFIAMAASAVHTSRIRLGTGVLIPSNRNALTTANSLASLNALAPGRIDFGIGTGWSGRRTMGLPKLRLSELKEYVRVVKALLAGEWVDWNFEGKSRKIGFLNPGAGLINLDDPIRVHISAMGPKSRQLAAELANGWLTVMMNTDGAIDEVRNIRGEWALTGKDPATCYTTAITLGCVLQENEPYDSPRAKAQAGPLAAILLHGLIEDGIESGLSPELDSLLSVYRKIYAGYEPKDARYLSIHRGHLLFLRPEEEALITANLIRDFTLTGTMDELLTKIRALRDAGYTQLAIQAIPGHEYALEEWMQVFRQV